MASKPSHRVKNPVQGYATMPGVLQSIAIPDGVCAICRGSGVRIEGILSLPKKKSYRRRHEPHSQKCSTRSPSASSRMTRTTLPSRRYVSFFRQEGLKHSEIISKALLFRTKAARQFNKTSCLSRAGNSRGNSLWRACLASGFCLRAMIWNRSKTVFLVGSFLARNLWVSIKAIVEKIAEGPQRENWLNF